MEKIIITMLTDRFGSENGYEVKRYLKDTSYSVCEELAKQFCDAGFATDGKTKKLKKAGLINAADEAAVYKEGANAAAAAELRNDGAK